MMWEKLKTHSLCSTNRAGSGHRLLDSSIERAASITIVLMEGNLDSLSFHAKISS